jgi:hypothetical protein
VSIFSLLDFLGTLCSLDLDIICLVKPELKIIGARGSWFRGIDLEGFKCDFNILEKILDFLGDICGCREFPNELFRWLKE